MASARASVKGRAVRPRSRSALAVVKNIRYFDMRNASSVTSGSPAASAGLKTGDVITAFGGQAIASPDDLTSAVSAKQPGDKVTVTYVRNGATNTTNVTLGTRAS